MSSRNDRLLLLGAIALHLGSAISRRNQKYPVVLVSSIDVREWADSENIYPDKFQGLQISSNVAVITEGSYKGQSSRVTQYDPPDNTYNLALDSDYHRGEGQYPPLQSPRSGLNPILRACSGSQPPVAGGTLSVLTSCHCVQPYDVVR